MIRAPKRIFKPAVRRTAERKKSSEEKEVVLRFVPLGGLEEIGRNCAFFEYGDEIVMIDAGIQFPEEETPGIDYIIPNVTYLEPKNKNIRGIILTHGHYDHIHSLPYIIEKIGNPLIYCVEITKALIEKRFSEFPNLPKPKFQIVKEGDRLAISEHFTAEFFYVDHTIPDAVGFVLETPAGNMAHFGDFRVEYDRKNNPINTEVFARLADKKIHTAFLDSTNADFEGHSISEEVVADELEKLIVAAKGRIILTTFASLLTRVAEIIKLAEKHGRKVAPNGRSMKDNIQIAQRLGHIKAKKGTFIAVEEIHQHPDNKVMILSTGGQGEPNAGLTKMANGEHRHIHFKKSDTVIFSSSVVPGNERSVQLLQDNIARQVDETYNSKLLDIHSSGHSLADDIELVLKLVKPKFMVPIHAYYFKLKAATKIAHKLGMPKENAVILDNGQVAILTKDNLIPTQEKVPTNYVMVDGLGIGDVEEVVLRDRRLLAEEGMVVVISTIDRETGRLLKTPDIISRGFIYLKENKELLDDVRGKLKSLLIRIPRHTHPEPDYIKTLIRDQIGQLLYNKTRRRPMVLPVLIEI
ncbi:MAG: ribonuclease J [Candidatus Harrisonbacteria bacterium]|nr:ribonuclease J [Candidatus Harrisonbacteria bacterium]